MLVGVTPAAADAVFSHINTRFDLISTAHHIHTNITIERRPTVAEEEEVMKLRRTYGFFFALPLLAVSVSEPAMAQGRAQGAIVTRDDAPIYASDQGEKTEAKTPKGYSVGGITVILGRVSSYMAESENGRVHILYLKGSSEKNALRRRAWMNPADLVFFTYECGCGEKDEPCAPVVTAGWISERWNPCFVEARDKKLAELKVQWEKGDTGSKAAAAPGGSPAPATAAEKALTNGDVVALVKAGLGDELVVSKIQQTPKETLDVSTDALIQLKKDGVSGSVLDAMVKKVGQRK